MFLILKDNFQIWFYKYKVILDNSSNNGYKGTDVKDYEDQKSFDYI